MDCQDYNTDSAERKKGQHLRLVERGAIKALKQEGLGIRATAAACMSPALWPTSAWKSCWASM